MVWRDGYSEVCRGSGSSHDLNRDLSYGGNTKIESGMSLENVLNLRRGVGGLFQTLV